MSKLTEAILTDRTGKDIAEKLHTLAVLKGIEVGSNLEKVTTMQEIRRIVQSGKAADVFQIGDQVIVPWTDTKTGTTYSVPMDVIKIANVTLKDVRDPLFMITTPVRRGKVLIWQEKG